MNISPISTDHWVKMSWSLSMDPTTSLRGRAIQLFSHSWPSRDVRPLRRLLCSFYPRKSKFFNITVTLKWNESGFRPPLCTYRLNWARRTAWGWWNDWDAIVLQTQDSKFEPWRSEAEHATSRSRRLPTILTFTRGWRRNIFCFFQTADTGNRTPNSGVKGSGANHYPRAPARRWLWAISTTRSEKCP